MNDTHPLNSRQDRDTVQKRRRPIYVGSRIELLPHRDYARRVQIEKLVAHLHSLGPRALAEFLSALSLEQGIGGAVIARLEEYRRLQPTTLAALGGDKFAPAPLRSVRR